MRRTIIIFAVAVLATVALGQGDSMTRRKVAPVNDGPATMSEASAVFVRVDRVLSRVVGVPITLPRLAPGDAPVKRSEIIARMDRLFELCKPQFKFTPKKVTYDVKLVALPINHPQRAPLEKLIRWGCIGKTSALAVNKTEAIGAAELGDAIGLFILRIADVTHRPDPKYTPIIGGGSDG